MPGSAPAYSRFHMTCHALTRPSPSASAADLGEILKLKLQVGMTYFEKTLCYMRVSRELDPKNIALKAAYICIDRNGSSRISVVQFNNKRRFKMCAQHARCEICTKACESHSAGEY